MFFKLPNFAWLGVLSAICGNLSAGFLGLLIIAPNVAFELSLKNLMVLLFDVILAIIFLVISVWLEGLSKNEQL